MNRDKKTLKIALWLILFGILLAIPIFAYSFETTSVGTTYLRPGESMSISKTIVDNDNNDEITSNYRKVFFLLSAVYGLIEMKTSPAGGFLGITSIFMFAIEF